MRSPRFEDRTDAGRRLASALKERGVDPDLVLAIPRGALPLGREIADAFDVPLDVVVASKIGAPGNPELAIGAVAADGSVWRNEEVFRATGTDETYFERLRREEARNAREKEATYREKRPAIDVSGKTVVVVDDGVATGSTARACLTSLETAGPATVVLAIPVGPSETVDELQELADDVVCLITPVEFGSVGQYYRDFGQVSDAKAMEHLESTAE